MNVIQTEIQGVVIIEPRIFGDSRGYFFESFSQKKFKELVADVDFVQDNENHLMVSSVVCIFRNRLMLRPNLSVL